MFLSNTRIEVIRSDFPRGKTRAALFDFDGTLSLIREGWPDVMIPMMVEHLVRTPAAEPRDELARRADLNYVQNEVRALDVASFFGEHIYGAIDDYQNFSKKMVIERLVRQLNLEPGGLVGFGDGFVEIEEVKRAGGIAIGVASDEKLRTGINDWKRNRLIQAGADIIVPDYRDLDALLDYLGFAPP